MASSLLDVCRFNPTAGSTTDWTYSSAVTGYQSPSAAGVSNGATYSYRAESNDLSQWEIGTGTYNTATGVLARTTVLFNSSGSTSKINFSTTPQVAFVALAEDLVTPSIIRGFIGGLTLSTAGSSSTFSVAAGVAVDSTNIDWLKLGSSYSKTTSAWAAGLSNGSLDTGTIAASTWYHVFLIKRADAGVVDVLASLSSTVPTLPTNYTLFRRIGSIKTNGSSQWTKFVQDGDEFQWDVGVGDVAANNPGTSAVTRTLSVPTGIRVLARCNCEIVGGTSGTSFAVFITDLSIADTAASNGPLTALGYFVGGISSLGIGTGGLSVMTNTSAQVRSRMQSSDATMTFWIYTNGWRDRRGQDA